MPASIPGTARLPMPNASVAQSRASATACGRNPTTIAPYQAPWMAPSLPITIISRSCDVRSRFSQPCNDIGPFSNGSFQLLVGGLCCLSLTACAR